MLNITVTNLRGNIFEILKRVQAGEQVIITHNKKKSLILNLLKNWTGVNKAQKK